MLDVRLVEKQKLVLDIESKFLFRKRRAIIEVVFDEPTMYEQIELLDRAKD
jgi:hypothetical protein